MKQLRRLRQVDQDIRLRRAAPAGITTFLGDGLVELSERCQAIVAEPMMCVGIVWLELDRSFVFARGSGQIDFAKEEHFSQRRVCFSEIRIKTESFEGGLFRFRTRLAPVCASVKRG